MIQINGLYENGIISLEKQVNTKKPIKLIVTFLEEEKKEKKKRLTFDDFSFKSSREKSKRYKGSISDSIIEERRNEGIKTI